MGRKLLRILIGVLAAFSGLVLVLGLVIMLFRIFPVGQFLEDSERRVYDLLAASAPWRPSRDIVLVTFDDTSAKRNSHHYGVWPYPRTIHADMIRFLHEAEARVIAYDIEFTTPHYGRQAADDALVRGFSRYENVYLGMRLDNEYEANKQYGLDLTMDDIEAAKPLTINLHSMLNPVQAQLEPLGHQFGLDEEGFYANNRLTFNNFRKLLDGFYKAGERIAFLNILPDRDGVLRRTPLFFRFSYQAPVKTRLFPLSYDRDLDQWYDAFNRPITRDGFLLDGEGLLSHRQVYSFYPSLALAVLGELREDKKKSGKKERQNLLTLTGNGHLQLPGLDIPLDKGGELYIKWYGANVERGDALQELDRLQEQRAALASSQTASDYQRQFELKELDVRISQLEKKLEAEFEPKPYREIPAWQIMNAIERGKSGELTPEDKALKQSLNSRIVFVGKTDAESNEARLTPVGLLPDVAVQATLFDNLYQDRGFIQRINPYFQVLILFLLVLLGVGVSLRLRLVVAEVLAMVLLVLFYVLTAVLMFHYFGVWINVVAPVLVLVTAGLLTFLLKYVQRNSAFKEAYAMANTDSMTGLYNHRYFISHMLESIQRAKRLDQKFSLILIDIDHFKKFNDTYGHQAGDEVLRSVAKKLRAMVRGADKVIRYGGEEMAVVLEIPTDEHAATEVAKKLVQAVGEEPYEISAGVYRNVTISAGVAAYPLHGETLEDLVEFADAGLYRAKESGRNQVGAMHD